MEAVEGVTSRIQGSLNALFVGHVGMQEARFFPDLVRKLLPGLVVDVRDQDVPAGLGEQAR